MRTPLVVANWKMNKTNSEASDFFDRLTANEEAFSSIEIVICPSFVALERAKSLLNESVIKIGAQNIYKENKGPFTGEVAALMIAPFCSYVILGHSERRKYFNETYADVKQKVNLALNYNIKPIICVGEILEERGKNLAEQVVKKQLETAIGSLSKELVRNIVIAYEPIWAIGTGVSDQPEESNLICSEIRKFLIELFDNEISETIRILYGGSITTENIDSFVKMPEVDGALIGGTSLNIESFLKIIESVKSNFQE